MKKITNYNSHFQEISLLLKNGNVAEAELLLDNLLIEHSKNYDVLLFALNFYKWIKKTETAIEINNKLLNLQPTNFSLYDSQAENYRFMNNWASACNVYERYLKLNDLNPTAHFNYAYHLKYSEQYQQSLEHYQKSLELNISQPEEALLNMANIYSDYLRDEETAKDLLNKAVSINKTYIPALYNLANLYEQEGEKEKTQELFQTILSLEPKHYQSLSRLADVIKFTDLRDPVIISLEQAVKKSGQEIETLIDMHFGLAKAYDDCKAFDLAFNQYNLANELNRSTMSKYHPEQMEELIARNINMFTKEWFETNSINNDKKLIFICGMFRSGSTLTEQILASHPLVLAGGEREYFVRTIHNKLTPYPESLVNMAGNELNEIAHGYIQDLESTFNTTNVVTDKRPDNFLYLGLIKTLFPNAHIIHTTRNPLDNCLSVYFLRLAEKMNYANDLKSIAHYYVQQEKLMRYWKTLFPDTIHEVIYDNLIDDPEKNIRTLLNFLDIEWNDNCLNFHKHKNKVKTASVWQVRQPLYQSSSGRWKNYEPFITELIEYFKHHQA